MIVLDASAAAEIGRGTKIGNCFRALIGDNEPIIVPDIFVSEVSNIAWKYVHAGLYNKEQALELHAHMTMLPDAVIPASELDVESLAQAIHFDHSYYDMQYLVLARRNNATLFTCDKKLLRICEMCGVSTPETVFLN